MRSSARAKLLRVLLPYWKYKYSFPNNKPIELTHQQSFHPPSDPLRVGDKTVFTFPEDAHLTIVTRAALKITSFWGFISMIKSMFLF